MLYHQYQIPKYQNNVQNLFENFFCSTNMENRKIDTWRDDTTSPSLREVVAVGQGTEREEDESGGHGVDVRIHFLVWNIVKKSGANLTIVSYNAKSLKMRLTTFFFFYVHTYFVKTFCTYIPTYVCTYSLHTTYNDSAVCSCKCRSQFYDRELQRHV
jgi:hypothetical protein